MGGIKKGLEKREKREKHIKKKMDVGRNKKIKIKNKIKNKNFQKEEESSLSSFLEFL